MYDNLTELILENCDFGLVCIDPKGSIRIWNFWMEERTGIGAKEAIGKNIREVFEDLPKSILEAIKSVIITGNPRVLSPVFHGSMIPAISAAKQFVKILPLKGESADIEGGVILIQDLTPQIDYEEALEIRHKDLIVSAKKARDEEKEAQDWLQQQLEFNNAITNSLGEGIFIFNRAGVITFTNPTTDHLLGWGRMGLVGMNVREFLDEKTMITSVLQHGETVKSDDEFFRRKDSTVFPVSYVSSPIIQKGKISWGVTTFQDITERKNIENEIKESYLRIRKILADTVRSLSSAAEMRDPYTASHQKKVTQLALKISKEMGLSEPRLLGLSMAGTLHDIGKINIPAEILSRPGKLNDYEMTILRTHPESGYEILKDIDFTQPVAEIVLQHHERLNGSGYPRGIKGDEILLEARILAVADVVEAMSSHRPYRPALGIEAALNEIEKNRDVLYDRQVVDVCLRLFREEGFKLE